MSDITKVCALCDFYNETAMDCERFPPSVKDNYVNDDGDDDCTWYQPFITHPWTTRCGEWREISNSFDDENHPDYEAANARLKIIVAALGIDQKENTEEHNADRDGT
jgi:hypothetical protein